MKLHPVLQFLTMVAVGQVPEFSFDRKLFKQLVEECGNGKSLNVLEPEPEITFQDGPIDGKLGYYEKETHRITVDQLEIFVVVLHSNPKDFDELKQRYDDELTRVLAHEGGHWHLDKRYGRWPWIEKKAWFVGWWAFGATLYLSLLALWWYLINRLFGPWLGSLVHPLIGIVASTVLYVAGLFWITVRLRILLAIWRILSVMVNYRFCYHERFAREFEERPAKDQRWGPVVKVS